MMTEKERETHYKGDLIPIEALIEKPFADNIKVFPKNPARIKQKSHTLPKMVKNKINRRRAKNKNAKLARKKNR